ncbi:hypothetical protein DYB28_000094 [Aphanomyces astaci]|uniref:Ribosomal protein L30 ferredoxin-like fold domain-containing protein n=1 Tax=Aphanomyces astaci TaxID=112090 RepID=A0A9X8DSH9_APHAT|nr:hypothetical protein DYB28_000094 [Aphanomyces astaci]
MAPTKATTKTTKAVSKTPAKANSVLVPESILKKRRTLEVVKAKKAEAVVAAKKHSLKVKQIAFKSAEKYVKEYRSIEKQNVLLRRQAKAVGNFYVPAEAKIAFVVRIRGIIGVSPKVRKILKLFRLTQIQNGVFVKLNKATINMLRLVEPFIAYGYPNLKSTRELIYKRGFGKINKQRIALTDNSLVEKVLGKFGIICIEDLIHEVFTCGPHFKEAANFLWPFQLSSPNGGYTQKLLHFAEGGDHGNRGEEINKFIKQILPVAIPPVAKTYDDDDVDMGGSTSAWHDMHNHDLMICMLQRNVQCELEGLRKMLHIQAMEVKWRGIAHQQADEIRYLPMPTGMDSMAQDESSDLEKAVAEKDKAIELLRNELRQALQLALVHEEDLATALDQREKEEQWRGMVEAQNRQLQDRLTQESQAKADMQATLVSVLQHNAPPMPPAHENVDAVRATPICAPKLQLNKQPPSSIPSHPGPHPQASAHGGTSIKNQFTTATVPSWK